MPPRSHVIYQGIQRVIYGGAGQGAGAAAAAHPGPCPNVAAACSGRGAPLPNAFPSQARAALESMDKKSLSEAQSLHSFEAKELER